MSTRLSYYVGRSSGISSGLLTRCVGDWPGRRLRGRDATRLACGGDNRKLRTHALPGWDNSSAVYAGRVELRPNDWTSIHHPGLLRGDG